MFDTNVFGVLNVLRQALPVLRAQRAGRVINISSVGGIRSAAGWGTYASTKFALEGISEALRAELAPLGVHVTIINPGYFRTDFLDGASLTTAATVIDDYEETAGRMRRRVPDINHAQPGDPPRAAAAILDVTEVANPPLRLPLGSDAAAAFETKLEYVAKELAEWRAVSLSTDFPQGT